MHDVVRSKYSNGSHDALVCVSLEIARSCFGLMVVYRFSVAVEEAALLAPMEHETLNGSFSMHGSADGIVERAARYVDGCVFFFFSFKCVRQ